MLWASGLTCLLAWDQSSVGRFSAIVISAAAVSGPALHVSTTNQHLQDLYDWVTRW